MNETKQSKTIRKRIVIAMGIGVMLAISLASVLAYSALSSTKSSQDQTLSWTESSYSFDLNATNNAEFSISTGGFRTLTIMVSALTLTGISVGNGLVEFGPTVFQVLVGSVVMGNIVDYHIYSAKSVYIFPPPFLFPGMAPWTETLNSPAANSFEQTFQIHSSEMLIWIWNNSTVNISGNVYYYLTT